MNAIHRSLATVVVACLLAAVAAAPAGAARPLTLGFGDGIFSAPASESAPWFQRAVDSGSTVVREGNGWASLSPRRPVSPADPADPAYRWQSLDDEVRNAAAHGLSPIISLTGAPAWAEGPQRPASAVAGAWRPDAAAYEQFARALGTRYSGTYPDPQNPGQSLPRVTYWQPWNEPNLSLYLAPQWVRQGTHYVPASPSIYRALLNGFYGGIKASEPAAVVVSAGTAPFGDPAPGGQRMMPALFVREMLCLHGRRLALEPCADPIHFDVLAHHPYSVGGPFNSALQPDDVSIPDMHKLAGPLLKAERTGRVLPRGPKPLWVTEVSYDSNPPDPQGVPQPEHARWTEETLYELWRQGVSLVTWYLIRDQPPVPSYAASYQSGMYLLGGQPKLSQRAFRFPFVMEPAGHGQTVAWTRAPVGGALQIQRRVGTGWQTVVSAPVRAGDVVERHVPAGRTPWRAVVAGQSSLAWPL
jgi:hypothetical protein